MDDFIAKSDLRHPLNGFKGRDKETKDERVYMYLAHVYLGK